MDELFCLSIYINWSDENADNCILYVASYRYADRNLPHMYNLFSQFQLGLNMHIQTKLL